MKIAILGTVPESRQLAPFNDHDWDIWACSPGNRGNCPRVTCWFELHGVADMCAPENASWAKDYFNWLKEQPFPVYMQERNDVVPQATIFPIKALLKEFGVLGRIAFTSSISMMIAYAILRGAKEIGVYGVDMAATEEAYGHQKPGCQIMLALAEQRGIKITIPLESCLATMPPLYGYAEASRMGRRLLLREQMCRQHIGQYDQTIERLTREREMMRGALEDVAYVRRTFVDGEDDAILDVASAEVRPLAQSGIQEQPDFGAFHFNKHTGLLQPKLNGSAERVESHRTRGGGETLEDFPVTGERQA